MDKPKKEPNMNYQEFKERISTAASFEIFEKWEKMYMAGEMDKDDFCKMVKPYVLKDIENEPHQNACIAHREAFKILLFQAEFELVNSNEDKVKEILTEAAKEATAYYSELNQIVK